MNYIDKISGDIKTKSQIEYEYSEIIHNSSYSADVIDELMNFDKFIEEFYEESVEQ